MDEDQYPIYMNDTGNLYAYDVISGGLYALKPGDCVSTPDKPLPGFVPKVGNLTMIGVYRLED